MPTFKKFEYENIHKKKNEPDPAVLQTSNLSNDFKKIIPKSHLTIPSIGIKSSRN
jgi:hypothetical protein